MRSSHGFQLALLCVVTGPGLAAAVIVQASSEDSSCASGSSFCGLVQQGTLVDEAWVFLRRVKGATPELATELENAWVGECSATELPDVMLMTRLREVVRNWHTPRAGAVEAASALIVASNSTQQNERLGKSVALRGERTQALRSQSTLEQHQEEQKHGDKEVDGDKAGRCAKHGILLNLGLNSESRVMDYGSGEGKLLEDLATCSVGHDNVGVDVQDVRPQATKDSGSFQFVHLGTPYVTSLASAIDARGFERSFDLIVSKVAFHHMGSEKNIRSTVAQLSRAMRPCAAFALWEWDNSGSPDLTPLFDLQHTGSHLLCLPWQPNSNCPAEINEAELHKMWEGNRTAYYSRGQYQKMMREAGDLHLVHEDVASNDRLLQMRKSGVVDASYPFLHIFSQVYRKGADCS